VIDMDVLGYDDSRTLKKKRTEILVAAGKLFTEQGIDRVSMQMIAAASGITRRSLYNYYESKEKIAVDIQILNLRKVKFFDTWNMLGVSAEEVKETIRDIFENYLGEYMFISCFDIYFCKGFPDRKYVDFVRGEILSRKYSPPDLDQRGIQIVDFTEFAEAELILAYTQRLVMRIVRESLTYDNVKDEVDLICQLLI